MLFIFVIMLFVRSVCHNVVCEKCRICTIDAQMMGLFIFCTDDVIVLFSL